ncbi:MAG: hypothetical protein ABIG67_09200 [Pseudomonadota bacterium]
MSPIEDNDQGPVILFPHSYLPESRAKKVLAIFRPITVFHPWFMEMPFHLSDMEREGLVRVVAPPEELRPKKDFKRILSEYKNWIRFHRDKALTGFLKANVRKGPGEETPWEIRELVRNQGRPSSPPLKEDDVLKWHLVLHLAREVEEERFEADVLLQTLKGRDTLLKGALEEDEGGGKLLSDLPGFEIEPIMDDHQLGQIFEAWFGLFGGYARGPVSLMTVHRQVINYVAEWGKDLGRLERVSDGEILRFTFRDLSRVEETGKRSFFPLFSEKAILFMEDV